MNNISGFGSGIYILASNTFPEGFFVSQFSDDVDPFDAPSLQIGDKAMDINGNLIVWSKANPINITIGLIPDSDDDVNMSILLDSNRISANKQSARDIITMTIIYPDGNNVVLNNGFMTDGIPFSSVSTAGRLKSKQYSFTFES